MPSAAVTEMRGRWEQAGEAYFCCPLCAGQIKHSRREHADMVAAIRHPLLPMVWSDGDDDWQVVSRGHHDAHRFLAAAAAHAETAGLLEDTEDAECEVAHVWWRYRPKARYEDGEWVGMWVDTQPGRGAVPFTVADLP
jgi:hypothetical protein